LGRLSTTKARRHLRRLACALLFALSLRATRLDAQAKPSAPLLPSAVAFDIAGNLYFSDTARNQVYESTLAGVLLVVAGDGVQGFGGDGGAATSAMLNAPEGIAIGSDDTLYIADTGNERIRAVQAGQISTFAGNGQAAFAGDNGPAASASFHSPGAIALDATGALLICDRGNQRIRRVSAGIVTTIAGSGVQGFSGDGASAIFAQIDTPTGIVVSADGRIFFSDSHNDRVRVLSSSGTINTFAGNGIRGYAGDGGAAVVAQLALPSGLAVTSAGDVLIADTNNQRIRSVNAQGVITTVVGSGIQGMANDGAAATTASLNLPFGLAISSFGAPVFVDALSHTVREFISPGALYLPAGLAPNQTSTVTLNVGSNMVYGQTSLTASVMGVAGTPQGQITLMDGTTVLAQMALISGSASFSATLLGVGTHALSAIYAGDGVNPTATSATTGVTVSSNIIIATANPATVEFGQSIPTLTGTITGVQPQDVGRVQVVFTTTAGPSSPPATYPIAATLTGPASGSYTVALSQTSGSLLVMQAMTVTNLQPISQSSFAGLPLILTASVLSTTSGTPTGTVSFLEGTTVLATAAVVNGIATGTCLSPSAGVHSITAIYSGDVDFVSSSSAVVSATVGSIPDFTLATNGSSTQTVLAGNVAVYMFSVAAQPAPFTGLVSMAVSGLPAGATATFAPPQVVPGSGVATMILNIQTPVPIVRNDLPQNWSARILVLALLFPLIFAKRAMWRRQVLLFVCVGSFLLLTAAGCGDRTLSSASLGSQTVLLNVSATSTNLVGAVVVHSTQITLIIQ
jgi:sugar lactone lactonase YvrE